MNWPITKFNYRNIFRFTDQMNKYNRNEQKYSFGIHTIQFQTIDLSNKIAQSLNGIDYLMKSNGKSRMGIK